MSYTIKLFNSSGFSKENIPDSPELLNSLEYLEIPSLNLIQDNIFHQQQNLPKYLQYLGLVIFLLKHAKNCIKQIFGSLSYLNKFDF